jgi:DNA-binding XRE family transcriptional regulator
MPSADRYTRLYPPGAPRTKRRQTLKGFERKALIAAREKLGVTRPALAKRLGVSRTFVFRIEVGEMDPKPELIVRWLDLLGPNVTVAVFEPLPKLRAWSDLTSRAQRDRAA